MTLLQWLALPEHADAVLVLEETRDRTLILYLSVLYRRPGGGGVAIQGGATAPKRQFLKNPRPFLNTIAEAVRQIDEVKWGLIP